MTRKKRTDKQESQEYMWHFNATRTDSTGRCVYSAEMRYRQKNVGRQEEEEEGKKEEASDSFKLWLLDGFTLEIQACIAANTANLIVYMVKTEKNSSHLPHSALVSPDLYASTPLKARYRDPPPTFQFPVRSDRRHFQPSSWSVAVSSLPLDLSIHHA